MNKGRDDTHTHTHTHTIRSGQRATLLKSVIDIGDAELTAATSHWMCQIKKKEKKETKQNESLTIYNPHDCDEKRMGEREKKMGRCTNINRRRTEFPWLQAAHS